jgi:hypothetical protein
MFIRAYRRLVAESGCVKIVEMLDVLGDVVFSSHNFS